MSSVVEVGQRAVTEKETRTHYIGQPIPRAEDARFMTGSASYVDDQEVPGSLFAAFLRSPYAHARIKRIDVSEAEKLPGVVAVVTGDDARRLTKPFVTSFNGKRLVTPNILAREAKEKPIRGTSFEEYSMGIDKVIFEGQLVAGVAATDRYTAVDAVELIKVDYEALPAVTDAELSMQPDAPLLYEKSGTNLVINDHIVYGDVDGAFKRAHTVVSERFVLHRYASTPIEKFGCTCKYDRQDQKITIWTNSQELRGTMMEIPHAFAIEEGNFRLIVGDIGGAYGNKKSIDDMVATVMLSMKSGRPVKYLQTEREMLSSLMQTSGAVFYVDIAADRDGIIEAMRTREIHDEGASAKSTGLYVTTKASVLTGNYKVPNLELNAFSVLTNKCGSGPNRGVGKPGTSFIIERMMDFLAKKLGVDRLEIRRRNFIQPHEFPYTQVSGNVYDSGDYPGSLNMALEKVGYEKLKKEQAELRKKGRYLGIGVACSVQSSASFNPRGLQTPSEAATVRVLPSGKVIVATGSESTGQGHETAVAQIVADELGVRPSDVSLAIGFDSEARPWVRYAGRFANKFAVVDTGAVVNAARNTRPKVLKVAAYMMGRSEDELTMEDAKVFVKNDRTKSLTLKEVAETAYKKVASLPKEVSSGLSASYVYTSPYGKPPDKEGKYWCHITFANSTHVPVVEVDAETGETKLLRYVAVEDVGNVINPLIVEGQEEGSILHGISATMGEEFVYDSDGHLMSATYMDYGKPTISETPKMELYHMHSPSPFTVLGTKGAGEGGAIPPLAAMASAVEDALEPFGAKVTQLPLTPENVMKIIKKN